MQNHFLAFLLIFALLPQCLSLPKSLFISLSGSETRVDFEPLMTLVSHCSPEERILDLVIQAAAPATGALFPSLKVLSEFFPLFRRVWVGSAFIPYADPSKRYTDALRNQTWLDENVRRAFEIGTEFFASFDEGDVSWEWGWYLSYEANGNYFVEVPFVLDGYIRLLQNWTESLSTVRDLPFLWSPNHWSFYRSIVPSKLSEAWATLAKSVPKLSRIDLQDFLGQTVKWSPPFNYDYSKAHTCEGDSSKYWELVKAACPSSVEVNVNMELFAVREDWSLVPADPAELSRREKCYADRGVTIGACYEIRNWYKAMTYGTEVWR